MGKITMYVLMLSVIMALFYLGGLIQNTPISILINLIVNPESIRTTSWYIILIDALAIVTAGGIIVGLITSQKVELVVKAGIVQFLFLIGWDFIVLFNILKQINLALAILFVSPLMLVYFLAAIEWWTGRD